MPYQLPWASDMSTLKHGHWSGHSRVHTPDISLVEEIVCEELTTLTNPWGN